MERNIGNGQTPAASKCRTEYVQLKRITLGGRTGNQQEFNILLCKIFFSEVWTYFKHQTLLGKNGNHRICIEICRIVEIGKTFKINQKRI